MQVDVVSVATKSNRNSGIGLEGHKYSCVVGSARRVEEQYCSFGEGNYQAVVLKAARVSGSLGAVRIYLEVLDRLPMG